ncbi:WD repeat-containing protein 55 [Prunus yedoensis var. nudiflora]|uniref:WD repeat-containing protein 55 n=1 Tax=Prunus yedoensis var. nudiflora TaxID=2094558 RepID=A0A314Y996_PRUYE|nr:WD repeat-containing protein 55 [Prunus yedoensis var. nudiflora]
MEINLGQLAFDIDFHPSQQLVTTGLINGDLHLYRYTSDSVPERVLQVHAHSESCRAARFINNGHAILTGSPDCSILATDVETGAAIARLEDAHGGAVNKLINLTESTVASGDDEGCIKVWDTRQQSCCYSFKVHEEYISDMTFAADSMKILGTSGDGTLSVCNLRRNKVQAQSEFSEEELLSVVIMKNGRKVVCSSHIGNLLLYSWGCFNDCSDRFVDFSPNSVDVLLKLDEDRLITGSETGLISLVGILPNRVIQPIAEHSEYPVEGLAFSHDKKFLGSIAHDQMLKVSLLLSLSLSQLCLYSVAWEVKDCELWDMDDLLQGSTKTLKHQAAVEDSDSDEMDMDNNPPKSKKGTKRKNASKDRVSGSSNNFFADLQMDG